jgi:hypothetical protein
MADRLVHLGGTVASDLPLSEQSAVIPAMGTVMNGGDNPVRNLIQWTSVRDANRAFADQQAAQFDQTWPELATAIRQAAIVPQAAQKKAIAKAFLKGLLKVHASNSDRYRTAAQVLSGPLLKGTGA